MRHLAITLSASVLLGALPVAAQQPPPRPERPYRGLFGGGVGESEQLLTLNLSLAAGYDDNLLADNSTTPGSITPGSGIGDPRQSHGGGFGNVAGRLSYSFSRTRVGVDASLGTSGRYYPNLDNGFFASHSASIGTFYQFGRNTRVAADHTTTYQPFLTLGVFPQLFVTPGEAIPPRQELGIDRSDYFNNISTVTLTQRLSRRAALSVNYGHHLSEFSDAGQDLARHSGGGGVTIGLARGFDFRAGYGYTEARYDAASADPFQAHNIDVGINFDRRLSFSRRTRLTFGTGSSVLVDRNRSSVGADRDRKLYRMNAQARLNHEIGRTWNASVAYVRDAGFIEAVSEPIFSDAVSVGFGGMVNRHVQFHTSVGATVGEFVLSEQQSEFDTYVASLGLTFGLTRHLGLGVNYSFYRYSFEENAFLPPGLSRETDRQSVQAHLNIWVPLMHRSRRPDAAR